MTATCDRHLGQYVLEGCTAAPICLSPTDVAGYKVTETSIAKATFSVATTCADTHTGTAQAAVCAESLTAYTLSGCEEKITCASPDSLVGYDVTEKNKVAQEFDVAVQCARGYEGTGVVTKCSQTGEKYQLSGCKYSTSTCVPPSSTKGYKLTEVEVRRIVFDVEAACAPGYTGTAVVTRCDKAPWRRGTPSPLFRIELPPAELPFGEGFA